MPSSRSVLKTRIAISPRLATRTLLKTATAPRTIAQPHLRSIHAVEAASLGVMYPISYPRRPGTPSGHVSKGHLDSKTRASYVAERAGYLLQLSISGALARPAGSPATPT